MPGFGSEHACHGMTAMRLQAGDQQQRTSCRNLLPPSPLSLLPPCFRTDTMACKSLLQPESLVRVHRAALLAWDYATPHNRGSAHGLRIDPLPQTCCVDHTPPPLSAQAQNRGQGITSSVGIAPLRRPINGAGFARSIARGDRVLALLAGE